MDETEPSNKRWVSQRNLSFLGVVAGRFVWFHAPTGMIMTSVHGQRSSAGRSLPALPLIKSWEKVYMVVVVALFSITLVLAAISPELLSSAKSGIVICVLTIVAAIPLTCLGYRFGARYYYGRLFLVYPVQLSEVEFDELISESVVYKLPTAYIIASSIFAILAGVLLVSTAPATFNTAMMLVLPTLLCLFLLSALYAPIQHYRRTRNSYTGAQRQKLLMDLKLNHSK